MQRQEASFIKLPQIMEWHRKQLAQNRTQKMHLGTQIALNCLEFHFLIKAPPCLACRKMVRSFMKYALSIRTQRDQLQPWNIPRSWLRQEPTQHCECWWHLGHCVSFQTHTHTHTHTHETSTTTTCKSPHAHPSAPSLGILAFLVALLRSVFMLCPTPILTD